MQCAVGGGGGLEINEGWLSGLWLSGYVQSLGATDLLEQTHLEHASKQQTVNNVIITCFFGKFW